jgi:sRNA-binding regulator protein Hfq
MNRKLIRPNMDEIKKRLGRPPKSRQDDSAQAGQTGGDSGNGSVPGKATAPQGMTSSRRKIAPPEQTNAESYYYLKQMQARTPMVVVLQDGERVRGVIEWYDKHCLKVHRAKEPNILLPKHSIKYLYKQEEEPRVRRGRGAAREEAAAERKEPEAQRYE